MMPTETERVECFVCARFAMLVVCFAVSWEEFYHYLSKSGYTLQQISANWHHMDENNDSKISFVEFWKGYRAQKQAQLAALEEMCEDKSEPRSPPSRVIEVEEEEKADMLGAIKLKLRKSSHKMRISKVAKLGKVLDEEKECEFERAEVGMSFQTVCLSVHVVV